MANPQTGDGFIRIANQLWDEVIRRDFSKRQKDILLFIWRLSYGCRHTVAIVPMLKDFELCGVPATQINGELKFLQQCKVLLWNPDQKQFSINKDYEQWQMAPVRKWDDDRFKELIAVNIKGEMTSQNMKSDFMKDEVLEGDDFTKHEVDTSQNMKSDFTKHEVKEGLSLTGTKDEEGSKDRFKDSIKDSSTRSLENIDTLADHSFGQIYKLFEEDFTANGKVSRIEVDDLTDHFETYGGEWLLEAMREAVRANKKSLSYINGVLNGFRKRGSCKKEKDIEPEIGASSSDSMFDEDDPIMRMMYEEEQIRRGTRAPATV